MASETTKLQVNFKTHKDGTLINLYADSVKELETLITDISMLATLIKTTEKELLTTPGVAASAPTAESIAAQFNAPAAPAAEAPGAKVCRHGAMAYKEGTNSAGKAWRAYMCNAPKGAPDKCEPIWVR
jgi:hypothetical protein